MSRLYTRLLLFFSVLLICVPAQALVVFRADLTHDQEVITPGIPDEGSSGIGIFILSGSGPTLSLSYFVTLTGLDIDGNQTPGDPNDNVTRTHFHFAPPGQNGGIVFGQIDLVNPATRNDLDDLVVDPVAGTIKGVWDGNEGNNTTLALQLANLLAGNLYFNVHTADHGGGEIRGQVLVVPEPVTLALFGIGLLGIAGMRRSAR